MSEKKLLNKGDIIRLENGMKIYAIIPEKFIFSNRPFSVESRHSLVCIGDILHKEETSTKDLEKKIMVLLKNQGIVDCDDKVKSFINDLNIDTQALDFDTSIFAGEYTVLHANYDGGGTQNGPNGPDTYPNGYHVYCQKNDNSEITVDFYQSGCFSAMIKDIEPI